MVNGNFFMSKFNPNIHQNALNCTILKKILESMPPNPPKHLRHANFLISKKNSCPPPPQSWGRHRQYDR